MDKIGIVSFYTEDLRDIGILVDVNKNDYAIKHGYTYISSCVDKNIISRPPAWYKLKMIESNLSIFDWVFWSDIDSVIVNDSIKLEKFIDHRYDVIITKDSNGINTGEFFIRNSEWSKVFLYRIWNEAKDINHPWWEQKSMMDLLEEDQNINDRVKIISDRSFNNYEITPETLIIHHAGLSNNRKELYKRIVDSLNVKNINK